MLQIISHPKYTHYQVTTNGREYDTYAHDVALLKLEEPLSLPYDKNLIATICLAPAERMYLNAPVVAVGWGSTQVRRRAGKVCLLLSDGDCFQILLTASCEIVMLLTKARNNLPT